jgi:hypothetical protein
MPIGFKAQDPLVDGDRIYTFSSPHLSFSNVSFARTGVATLADWPARLKVPPPGTKSTFWGKQDMTFRLAGAFCPRQLPYPFFA